MARCKECGRHIKPKYYYETGLCHRCYQQINKNERIENRLAQKKSSVRDYFVKKFSRTSIITSIIILIVISILYILYSISSSGGIVGKWQSDEDKTKTFQFKSDGTLTFIPKGQDQELSVGYQLIDKNTMNLTENGKGILVNYKFDQNKLILTVGGEIIGSLTRVSSENSFSQLATSVKKTLPQLISKECPQINVPAIGNDYNNAFIWQQVYDGWKIDAYADFDVTISCHMGNREGQKPNYLYCGDIGGGDEIAYMQKTLMNSDGTIGKTIRRSFVNIYEVSINKEYDPIIDEQIKSECNKYVYEYYTKSQNVTLEFEGRPFQCGKDEFKYKYKYIFKETICGEDPAKIAEKDWKEIKDSIRSFWD